MDILLENFKYLTTTPKNVEQLKKLVLQLAVQGKLTAQWRKDNPGIEPASVLLEKIKAEKEQLVKEGKIKRAKPLPKISVEETPFELPDKWSWERLGNFCYIASGSTPSKEAFVSEGIPYLKMYNLKNQKIDFLHKPQYIKPEIHNRQLKRSRTEVGDVIMNIVGPPLGKLAIIPESLPDCNFNQAGVLIRPLLFKEFNSWIFYYLNEMSAINSIATKGVAGQDNISITQSKNIKISLPPLPEQQAIVSKVESLFEQIDQLHALAHKKIKYRENTAKALFSKINTAINDTELQETWQLLNNNFKTLTQSKESVKQLRQSILQLAVQGKLTANWRESRKLSGPDIEPASVLLEKIKEEKEQLIKDKLVKQGKKQPPATSLILVVPESWLVSDLDDISQYITDGTHQTPRYVEKGKMFLSAQNVKPFKFMPENHKYVSEEAYEEYVSNRKAEKGDILVGRVGSKGEAAVVDKDLDFAIYVSLGLVKTFQVYTSPDYLTIVMNSPYGNDYASGNMSSLGASAGNFNLGRIRSFPIPFPPLEEQNEIVSKVNQLMAWCDKLEKKIEKRNAYQERIMQAVVKQAI